MNVVPFACVPQDESPLAGGGDLGASCCGGIKSSEEQERGPAPFGRQIYHTGSSCSPLGWGEPACGALGALDAYGRDSDSDSLGGPLGDCSLALAGLRGSVSQGDPCYAGPFFKDVEREAREERGGRPAGDSDSTEGIIFYNQVRPAARPSAPVEMRLRQTNLFPPVTPCQNIQPVDSEYKEGREYVLTQFIKGGSYGEVHSAQDVNTGFKFAVKKVPRSLPALILGLLGDAVLSQCSRSHSVSPPPSQIALKRFSSEEVGAWSALRSPRVVELFGVVREGPNVLLIMDHKYGEQAPPPFFFFAHVLFCCCSTCDGWSAKT